MPILMGIVHSKKFFEEKSTKDKLIDINNNFYALVYELQCVGMHKLSEEVNKSYKEFTKSLEETLHEK